MKHYALSLFSMMLLCLLWSCDSEEALSELFEEEQQKEEQADLSSSDLVNDIHRLVNEHRQSKGSQPMILDDFMSSVAKEHSKNMALGTTPFGHDGFSDRITVIKKEIGGGASAENVAVGHRTAEAVMEGWIKSTGHRENIEGNYTHIGIGTYQQEGGSIYYTQIFIRK